jgi:ABC-type Co2+ transport system permease subunit
VREGSFWPAVGIGAAAYFIVSQLHIPVIGGLLAWLALGWAGYWFVENSPRRALAWLWAAVVGAAAGIGGSIIGLALTLLLSILHPLQIPYELLALLNLLFGMLFTVVPIGAICGGIGGYISVRRGGGRPWRRWDSH